jgi:outer membrane receptor protein involved in Fe transport
MTQSIGCVVSLATCLSLASAALCAAQPFQLRGSVIDQATGKALAGARVELLPDGRLTDTKADGSWRFDAVQPGSYTIRVTAEHFEMAIVPVTAPAGESRVDHVTLTRRPYYAQESVTVTARRDTARAYDVPRSVTVIDAGELERRLPRTTPEALADSPGIFLQKTGHGGGAPYVRGLIGNQVLVLIDGIRLNNATFRYGPNQYLATIDPAIIERIEVLRGAGSVLYGSDAIGGVINIVTRRPGEVGQPFSARARASTKVVTSGMEQSGRLELAAAGPHGGVVGGLSLRSFGDLRAGRGVGIQSPSGYDEVAGDMRAEVKLPQAQSLTFSYQHHRQDEVPRYDQVVDRGFARSSFDPQERQVGSVRYERALRGLWASTVRAIGSLQRTTEQRKYQPGQSDVVTTERDEVRVGGLSVEVQSRPLRSVSMVSGFDYYRDSVDSRRRDARDTTNQVEDRRGLYADGATARSMALFTHATLTRSRWLVDAGVRVSRIEVSVPESAVGPSQIAPTNVIGSAGGLLTVVDGVRLFGSVSQAFRAPNIDDLSSLGPFDFGVEVPSPHLRPETSLAAEGGVKLRSGRAGASLSVYRTSLSQLIDRVPGLFNGSPLIGTQAVYQKANVGSAFIRGVEAEGELSVTSSLTMSGFVTYTYGQAVTRDEPLRRIPPLNGLFGLRFTPASRMWIDGSLRFATRQDRLAAGDRADHRIRPGGTPGWMVISLNAGHRLGGRADLVGGIQNLFDEAYRTHGSGIDGQGRSAWIGLNARLW